MKTVGEILEQLGKHWPSEAAEEWDNVGLLVGDRQWKTAGAVVSIDLTSEVIAEARSRKARLIINHHPCIFPKNHGLSRVTPEHTSFEALTQGMAVCAFHTNFDVCDLNVIQTVSRGLSVNPQGRLLENTAEALLKLSVFVPTSHIEKVRTAICEAGAGQIGNYDFCTFATGGEGTFRGGKNARPFLGKPGRIERAKELRLETVFPRGLKNTILATLRTSHPYEEIAYDLYPVVQTLSPVGLNPGLGYGFWGDLSKPKPFSDVAKDVKSLFNIDGFWLTVPPLTSGKRIPAFKRIAFVAGKGSAFIGPALSRRCDLFITGEAGYHSALMARRNGMAVMELGHSESEQFFVSTVQKELMKLGVKTYEIESTTQRLSTGGEE